MKSKFKIEGLDCANCAAELESIIKKIEGITEVSISFMTERLVVEYNENMKLIIKIIIAIIISIILSIITFFALGIAEIAFLRQGH